MSHKIDSIDDEVFSMLSKDEYIPITDMVSNGLVRVGTVRNSLNRLLAKDRVARRWDGNQRFGRYTYCAK
jgi:hypothetical protein